MMTGQPNASAASTTKGPGQGRWWLLPAVTFLVGLVLGGVIIAVTRGGDAASTAAGSSSTTTAASPSVGTGPTVTATVTAAATLSVPRECLKVVDDSKAVTDVVTKMVTAARDLDAAKLSDLVRQLQTAQNTLTDHAATCKNAQADLPSITATTQ